MYTESLTAEGKCFKILQPLHIHETGLITLLISVHINQLAQKYDKLFRAEGNTTSIQKVMKVKGFEAYTLLTTALQSADSGYTLLTNELQAADSGYTLLTTELQAADRGYTLLTTALQSKVSSRYSVYTAHLQVEYLHLFRSCLVLPHM
jgi:hypothetical protein